MRGYGLIIFHEAIDFSWNATEAPAPGLSSQYFSVLWLGTVSPSLPPPLPLLFSFLLSLSLSRSFSPLSSLYSPSSLSRYLPFICTPPRSLLPFHKWFFVAYSTC